jgi:MFS family permease
MSCGYVLKTVFGEDAAVLRNVDFRLLLLATIMGPLGSALISPLLDSLTEPLGATSTSIGLLLSAYTAPAVVAIPVGGVLADQYGRKPVLVGGLVLFSVSGVAIAFTTEFRVALALRVLQGLGGAGIVPIIVTAIGDLYVGSREATAQGLRFSASALSLMVVPLLAGVLVGIAWQYPFLLFALALPITGLLFLHLEEPLHLAGTGSETDATATGDDPGGGILDALLDLLRSRRVAVMVVARGIPQFVYFGFLTYNSIVVVRGIGGSPAGAGLLVALSSGAMAVSASQAGRLTDVFGNRYYPLLVANLFLGAGFVVVSYAPSLTVAGLGSAAIGGSLGVLLSLYRSIITGLATPGVRGSVVSLTESVGRLGSTVAPLLLGASVAWLQPSAGLLAAVRWTALGASVLCTLVSLICMVLFFVAWPESGAPATSH